MLTEVLMLSVWENSSSWIIQLPELHKLLHAFLLWEKKVMEKAERAQALKQLFLSDHASSGL